MLYEKESLHNIFESILEEARLVFPGAQTLFGFQLVVVFTDFFQTKLDYMEKVIHFGAMSFTFLSFCIILTLTAYHRHVDYERISRHLILVSSKILSIGMMPLMLAFALDFYLIMLITFNETVLATALAITVFILMFTLWYLLPKSSLVESKKN